MTPTSLADLFTSKAILQIARTICKIVLQCSNQLDQKIKPKNVIELIDMIELINMTPMSKNKSP